MVSHQVNIEVRYYDILIVVIFLFPIDIIKEALQLKKLQRFLFAFFGKK